MMIFFLCLLLCISYCATILDQKLGKKSTCWQRQERVEAKEPKDTAQSTWTKAASRDSKQGFILVEPCMGAANVMATA